MIVLDGVTYDLVVQRDGMDWIVADPDGVIFSRHETRRAAERALAVREDHLIGQGGRRVGRAETQETQERHGPLDRAQGVARGGAERVLMNREAAPAAKPVPPRTETQETQETNRGTR